MAKTTGKTAGKTAEKKTANKKAVTAKSSAKKTIAEVKQESDDKTAAKEQKPLVYLNNIPNSMIADRKRKDNDLQFKQVSVYVDTACVKDKLPKSYKKPSAVISFPVDSNRVTVSKRFTKQADGTLISKDSKSLSSVRLNDADYERKVQLTVPGEDYVHFTMSDGDIAEHVKLAQKQYVKSKAQARTESRAKDAEISTEEISTEDQAEV